MTGVASSTCFQPTGGEAGGEIRNCLSGFGGARWELPMCRVWGERGRGAMQTQCDNTAQAGQQAGGLVKWPRGRPVQAGAAVTGAPPRVGTHRRPCWAQTVENG